MNAQWQALSARDRRIVKVGAVLVAVLLFWAWLWDPLAVSRAQLREQAAQNETVLAWMRPAAEQLAARGGVVASAVPVDDGRSLLARVDASARAAGLGTQLTAVEPQGETRVRVQFSAVDFDALMAWLESQSTAGIRIEALGVVRAAGSGRTDAQVSLQASR